MFWFNKFVLTLAAATLLFTGKTFASASIFGGFLELQVNESPTGSWYQLEDPGLNQLVAIPADPMILNLGVVDVLNLTDAEVFPYHDTGDLPTGANLVWRLIDGNTTSSFTTVSLPFGEDEPADDPAGNNYSTPGFAIWGGTTIFGGASVMETQNVLLGLSPGTYILNLYEDATGGDGTAFINGFGHNYDIEFTIVPEPSTMTLMVFAVVGLVTMRRRRTVAQ